MPTVAVLCGGWHGKRWNRRARPLSTPIRRTSIPTSTNSVGCCPPEGSGERLPR
ncbi:hypothetical protein I553_7388 [Mycobacterium xenopi 4042]|uniref:Uncharacterized protein n=1 Tax=Mycobacterium xenopi 4042 TaxID=1299334 RepID=X8E619_MYCXE|nr:hypothetical protein I553_7388 [Mycobacterium xenopi 4042]